MTGSAAGEQIDLERNCEGGIEKMKERGRGRGRWCLALFNYHQSCIGFPPPSFQNKETNFSHSSSGSRRKNHIISPDSPGAVTL